MSLMAVCSPHRAAAPSWDTRPHVLPPYIILPLLQNAGRISLSRLPRDIYVEPLHDLLSYAFVEKIDCCSSRE